MNRNARLAENSLALSAKTTAANSANTSAEGAIGRAAAAENRSGPRSNHIGPLGNPVQSRYPRALIIIMTFVARDANASQTDRREESAIRADGCAQKQADGRGQIAVEQE